MNSDLHQLLSTLKLKRIDAIVDEHLVRAIDESPSYADFLTSLLRSQAHYQRQRKLEYRLKQAKLPVAWSIETFPFDKQPSVSRHIIAQLTELDFVPNACNIVFIGPTGVGKTGLACGLLRKALENGYRGRFIRAQDLFDQMYTTLADRSTRKYLNHLIKLDVLLIDEFSYLNVRPEQAHIFFKLMEERYNNKPTIITTNLDYNAWYEFLGQKDMVGALLDRLQHRCHTLRIHGTSLRAPIHPDVSANASKQPL